ncbi:MAG: lipid A export permease/ATP-binding protein MsbA [Gammaproteobacteria bacterium RIFCSPHIGHO2_12_FULL_38_14]|nr:MAG: lipid A export permease/ATP-binding protein MsbA [Gammaproteobacteria bacterium RIFCSPHIGHO2_12_FULL_38_14]
MSSLTSKNKQVVNAFQLYKRLFVYVRRYWIALVVAGLASMLYSGIDAWFVYFLKPLLNEGLINKNHHFLTFAPFLVMAIFILRGTVSFFSNFYIAYASRGVIMHLRQDLFSHLQKLPARFYDHTTTGQVLAVVLYGVDQVANASADVLTTAVQAIFLISGLIIVMFSISWKLTIIYFMILPLITIVMRVASLRIRRLSLRIQDSIADLNHCTEENIEGYKVVRAFEGQDYEAEKFNNATRVNREREMKVVIARSVSVSVVQFITACTLAITLYIATLEISDSILTPGGFVAMVAAMLALLKPMKDLAFVQNKLYRGLAGAQSVFQLMDEATEKDHGHLSLHRANGHITFSDINFTYNDHKKALHDVTFTVEPGEVVAIVGRSGSGKSTLVSLLPRFYDHYTGHICLDYLSIRDYKLKDLRRQFALVSQHVTLFHDTVFNNIAYGQLGQVTEEAVLAAAQASYAMEFISQLPQGMQSLIGENGVLLSGGQRQRIAIARAILKNAPVLILDEATSALDTESERYIQAALDELIKNRTTLIIAHRLSTIEHADKIIVMDEGRVVEVGDHATLLAKQGHYAKLHHMQFRDTPSLLETAYHA